MDTFIQVKWTITHTDSEYYKDIKNKPLSIFILMKQPSTIMISNQVRECFFILRVHTYKNTLILKQGTVVFNVNLGLVNV